MSNRDYTFEILRSTKECVINVPTAALAKKVVAVGNVTGKKVDKFAKYALTPESASCVRAPLIAGRSVKLPSRMK